MSKIISLIIGVTIITIYIILASVCCKFMAVAFYYPLNLFNEVEIVRSPINSGMLSDGYDHVYLLVNKKPYEPRFLGLYLKDSVDYHIITNRYNNPKEYSKHDNIVPFY